MRILITGASGFLGQHVLSCLGAECDGYALAQMKSTPECAGLAPNMEWIRGDILRPQTFASKVNSLDAVIHLAAVNKTTNDLRYEKLLATNTTGVFNMLELARKKSASNFIFASSAAVYGDKRTLPIKETYLPDPVSIYGLSKLIGEQMCSFFSFNYSLATICLRISNMYGPGQGTGFVVSDLIRKSLCQKTVEVTHPEATRDFIYVDDVAEAVARCLSFVGGRGSEVINIGSGVETSIRKISRLIGKFSGRGVVFKKNYAHAHITKRSVLDIDKALRMLDWKPKVSLEAGLRSAWEHAKNGTGI
jgi:nucleoside-diphosphate-sugar epimerase